MILLVMTGEVDIRQVKVVQTEQNPTCSIERYLMEV